MFIIFLMVFFAPLVFCVLQAIYIKALKDQIAAHEEYSYELQDEILEMSMAMLKLQMEGI